jgi:hypothetical protein
MSEELNKEIRDFFIKICEDIKTAFEECCTCCINRSRVHPRDVSDIENQVTEDMNSINQNSHVIVQIEEYEDLKVDNYVLEDNVFVRKNKVSYYYDCNDCKDYCGDETEFETKCVDSDCSEDDFVIIY